MQEVFSDKIVKEKAWTKNTFNNQLILSYAIVKLSFLYFLLFLLNWSFLMCLKVLRTCVCTYKEGLKE
jgi:hypothetical protein